MNKQTLRTIIREELLKEASKSKLNESLLEKLLMAFLSPLIKREIKKIKNDPDIIAAQQSVEYAIDNYLAASKRQIDALKAAEKKREEERAEFWKSRNKK